MIEFLIGFVCGFIFFPFLAFILIYIIKNHYDLNHNIIEDLEEKNGR